MSVEHRSKKTSTMHIERKSRKSNSKSKSKSKSMAVAKRTKARGLYILLAQEQDAKAHTRKQDDSNEHNRHTNGAASRKDNNEKPATKPTKREKTKRKTDLRVFV